MLQIEKYGECVTRGTAGGRITLRDYMNRSALNTDLEDYFGPPMIPFSCQFRSISSRTTSHIRCLRQWVITLGT